MPSITERKRRQEKSKLLRRARSKLLAELERLEDELCDKCKVVKGNSPRLRCGCQAAVRIREIGQELLTLLNERTKIKMRPKGVKLVAENKSVKLTEEAVNEMKAAGMTYAEIAKHFGISAPTLANRRQNWELERVRAQRQEEKTIPQNAESSKTKSEPKVMTVESSAVPPSTAKYEDEIEGLKETMVRKDEIISELHSKINLLMAEREVEGNPTITTTNDRQDERRLLAILLEREAARMRRLVVTG